MTNITPDSSGSSSGTGTSLSYTHTVSSTAVKPGLFAFCFASGATVTSATCDGVPMIFIDQVTTIPGESGQMYLYYVTNVKRGAHTIKFNFSGNTNATAVSEAYNNIDPGMNFYGGSATDVVSSASAYVSSGSTATATATLTTRMRSCWTLLAGYQGGSSPTAGSGSTLRASGSQCAIYDSNGAIDPAGSNSMSMTVNGIFNGGAAIMISMSPAQGSVSDLAATLVTSGYKWLTSTLLAAQQQFAVRPYFTAQIFDDTIQPNAVLANGAGNPPNLASSATAPDGKIYSAGIDGSGNLKLWSSSNLHGVAGSWETVKTLTTTGENINDPSNVVSIAISDWVGSTYQINVWYFANFTNDGSNLQLKYQYSTDQGNTWSEGTFTLSSYPNNALGRPALAAMQPVVDTVSGSAILQVGAFYTKPNGSYQDVYYIYGNVHGYSSDVKWSKLANSGDWTIHSLDSYYLNGKHFLLMSAYHNILDSVENANYSLWVTSLQNITNSSLTDLWSQATAVLPVGSATAQNQNAFTYPSTAVITQNNQTLVYLTCRATLVDSVTTSASGTNATVVSTHSNYFFMQSDDGKTFSYPAVLTGPDSSEFAPGSYPATFTNQGNYFYAIGNGWIYEYLMSNMVADVTQDVIGYSISEAAGQPSSITLNVANANNKWYGNTPTGPGASAIGRNRKVLIGQGYYNASGVPEVVPRNVYYIDDITQTVTGTQNDLAITGRDWYKKLKTTVTRFTYSFVGPTFFADIFDGTFTSLWNQIAGVWTFIGSINPPLLEVTSGPGTIALVSANGTSFGHFYRVSFRAPPTTPSGTNFYFYAIYIDANNWLRLDLDMYGGTAWKVTKCVGGSQTDLGTGTLPHTIADNFYHNVYIRRYDYFKFNFMISIYTSATVGNNIYEYDPSTISYTFNDGNNGEYDLTGVFSDQFTVGIGTSNGSLADFRFFTFTQFNTPNNLASVMRSIARIAGIFNFKFTNTFREYLYTSSNFTGTFDITNRQLNIAPSGQALSLNNFTNGEIDFEAAIKPIDGTANAGFQFIFRKAPDTSGFDDYYAFHAIQASTGFDNPPVYFRFERYIQNLGKTYIFYNSNYDVSNNPVTTAQSFSFNLQKNNKYRIFMIDGWMYAFVNDEMVASFNDNNTTFDYQTTGLWGFQSDANTLTTVQHIAAPDFWKPVQTFSYNPGDDAESALDSLFASLRAWMFSDLFGRFKAIFTNSTDSPNYTYNTQLFQQNTDVSDKEYVSQVTVYGSGVSATARNTTLFAGAPTREQVIVDYTITQEADAQTRANNELINSNQFLGQYTPKQVINVGAEMFDPITITNTGNNTSGVNGNTRVYSETFSVGGGNNNTDYSVELDTGTL